MKLSLIILFLLAFTGCAKIKSDTNIPKQFLSDDALEFDLIGKIKNVEWIIVDSTSMGNDAELYKGYYKGTVDTLKLEYDRNFKLIRADLMSRSMRTYDKNAGGKIVFKNENVLLYRYTEVKNQDLSQSNYRMLIKDHKLVNSLWLHRLYYNEHGDVKEAHVLDQAMAKKHQETEKIEYFYSYDERGNWIERRIISGPRKERFNSQTDYRNIQYQ